MNQKISLTQYVASELGLENNYTEYLNLWWKDLRIKEHGGLELTSDGFQALTNAGIKSYNIHYDEPPVYFSNQLIIRLNRYIDCPYYLTKNEIYVFGERMAVQLLLFSGNIERFSSSKAESLKT